jgi:hypothetical protein
MANKRCCWLLIINHRIKVTALQKGTVATAAPVFEYLNTERLRVRSSHEAEDFYNTYIDIAY